MDRSSFRGRVFDTLADKLDTEINDLLAGDDLDGDLFDSVAQAANDAMITSFVSDLQAREAIAA